MGRSRTVFHSSADDDPNQSRSKRKKAVSDLDTLQPCATGQETNEEKKGLYHCNYCNRDISEYIRIKCAVCPDFDLCVECFTVGAEVTPHKSNHPYRVMDNLSFPLLCPDWNADEEMLLIEGIGMYGISNWTVVAEHVGTKSRKHCIDHYNAIYMNSPCFPIPDMSHIEGKTREDLLAMAKELREDMKGSPSVGELTVKEEPSTSATFKVEDQMEGVSTVQPSSDISPELGTGIGSGLSVNAGKRVSEVKDGRDNIKVEDSHSERTIGGKKLRISGDERHSVTERSGYNSKRQEFEVEYDNDAEQLLADMEFKDTDTAAERAVKLRVLHIYSKKLDERKRRKDFLLERNLLYPDPFEKDLSPEEREICRRYRVFMRYHTKEEHEELLNSIIEEHRTMKRIQDLQEARAAGCCTSAQAERFIEEKRKKEAEESGRKLKDGAHGSPSSRSFQRASHLKVEPDNNSPRGNVRGSMLADSGGKDSSSSARYAVSHSSDTWDIRGLPGADLLSEMEKQLCGEIKILPSHYLSILQTLATKVGDGSIKQKHDAHNLFNVDPSKVDRIYDMLEEKGIISAP